MNGVSFSSSCLASYVREQSRFSSVQDSVVLRTIPEFFDPLLERWS